jgi:hypothetical protein
MLDRTLRFGRACYALALGSLVALAACGGKTDGDGPAGEAGSPGSGGAVGSGGAIGSGGAVTVDAGDDRGEPGDGSPVVSGGACAPEGASAMSADGCNTCGCASGTWFCSHHVCTMPTCEAGAMKPAADGCNTCRCFQGDWDCTTLPCLNKACGARAGNTCSNTEYCAYAEGDLCGAADAEALCKPRPVACDDIYAPVCGCDRMTYPSDCDAAMHGSGVYTSGPCK